MKDVLKKIIDTFLSTILLVISAYITITFVPSIIITIPTMIISANRISNIYQGNYVKDSIFSISKNGKINQNFIDSPFKIFKILKEKNKQALLLKEEFNMFKQLKKYDNKGNNICYHTVSQSLTVKILRILEKEGYIENLFYSKKKKSNLFFEKLLIGNIKKSNNKKQMYDIKFNITDKKISIEDFYSIINSPSNNNKDYQYETNNIVLDSQKKKRHELKDLKFTIIDYDNDEKKNMIK